MVKNFDSTDDLSIGVKMDKYAAFVLAISKMGRMPDLKRLSKLLEALEDEPPVTYGEKACDLMFVVCTNPREWPDDDNELLEIYIDWLQREFIGVELRAGVG